MSASISGFITPDTELFINSIKKRPALYMPLHKDYNNTDCKKNQWIEVCNEVVIGWSKLDFSSKNLIGRDVQKKWLNLRTCYSRELKAQRTDFGVTAMKRRKYIFFDKLKFLQPCFNSTFMLSDQPDDQQNNSVVNVGTQVVEEAKKPNSPMATPKAEGFQDILMHVLAQDSDEDKSFALSLVPTLKSLTDTEKLQAKIEILQVLQRIKSNDF